MTAISIVCAAMPFVLVVVYVLGFRAGLRAQIHQAALLNPTAPPPVMPSVAETLSAVVPHVPESPQRRPMCTKCKKDEAVDAWGLCGSCDEEELRHWSAAQMDTPEKQA